MKRKDLEKVLRDHGWYKVGGTKHDKWTNGEKIQMVPRHTEINEHTAKGIIKEVQANPAPKKEK